jgi:hypothetical protein
MFSGATISVKGLTVVVAVKGRDYSEQKQNIRKKVQDDIRKASEYFSQGREDVSGVAAELSGNAGSFFGRLGAGMAGSLFARLVANLKVTVEGIRVVIIHEELSLGCTVERVSFDNEGLVGGVFGERRRRNTERDEEHDVNKSLKVEGVSLFVMDLEERKGDVGSEGGSDMFFPSSSSSPSTFLLPFSVQSKLSLHSTLIDASTSPTNSNLTSVTSLEPLNFHFTRSIISNLESFNESVNKAVNGRPVFSPRNDFREEKHETYLKTKGREGEYRPRNR